MKISPSWLKTTTGEIPQNPALVVSTDELQNEEGGFYAVLISSKNIHPQYTLEIKDSDLIGSDSLDKKSFYDRFNQMVNKVIDSIFGPEE